MIDRPDPSGALARAGAPDRDVLEHAHRVLRGVAHRTPVLASSTLDGRTGVELVAKCESFQRAGAFKFRGAYFAVSRLEQATRARGVVTHSSGNHGQALALAARLHDCRATIVVPEGAPQSKVDAIAGYGARIVRCAPTVAAREAAARRVVAETGGHLVHPFDDPDVIAGQSTVARELFEQVPDLDAIVVPVGGGGLLSGTLLAAHYFAPHVAVYAAEPAGADDAARSLAAGRRLENETVDTLADGLRTHLAERTFGIVQALVRDIVTVGDEAILAAQRFVLERMKLVVEPSAAVPVAALLPAHRPSNRRRLDLTGQSVAVVLTGGNLDLDPLFSGA